MFGEPNFSHRELNKKINKKTNKLKTEKNYVPFAIGSTLKLA